MYSNVLLTHELNNIVTFCKFIWRRLNFYILNGTDIVGLDKGQKNYCIYSGIKCEYILPKLP